MKKDKPFTEKGAFAGIDYGIHYFSEDEYMTKSLTAELKYLDRKFRIDIYPSDVRKTRKFIKALKKGLRRLER